MAVTSLWRGLAHMRACGFQGMWGRSVANRYGRSERLNLLGGGIQRLRLLSCLLSLDAKGGDTSIVRRMNDSQLFPSLKCQTP